MAQKNPLGHSYLGPIMLNDYRKNNYKIQHMKCNRCGFIYQGIYVFPETMMKFFNHPTCDEYLICTIMES